MSETIENIVDLDEYLVHAAMHPFDIPEVESQPIFYVPELGPQQSIETFTTPETRYLSNMYRLENYIETELGFLVPSTEHAYQANRFVDEADHKAISLVDKPTKTKSLAHELLEAGHPEKPDWEFTKVDVMYSIVKQKFLRNPDIRAKLLATGDMELVEGNYWKDRYWGVCPIGSRDGQNHLGRILMRVRFELQNHDLAA